MSRLQRNVTIAFKVNITKTLFLLYTSEMSVLVGKHGYCLFAKVQHQESTFMSSCRQAVKVTHEEHSNGIIQS